MKICALCKEEKSLNLFGKVKTYNGLGVKYRSYCNPCRVVYNSANDKNHSERIVLSRRKIKLKSRYNITPEDYKSQLSLQLGQCSLCSIDLSKLNRKNIHLDHNHTTGKLRGILCSTCNSGLGMFKDKPDILRRALDYIESDGVWYEKRNLA